MKLDVRKIDDRTVEILAEEGRVVARVTGERLSLSVSPRQPCIAPIDLREITDDDVRPLAEKLNAVIEALCGAKIVKGGE